MGRTIHEFKATINYFIFVMIFFGQVQPTNSSTNEIVIFHETVKIGTHKNKRIHSMVTHKFVYELWCVD